VGVRFVGKFGSHVPSVVLQNPLTATGAGALMRAMSSSISGVAALAFDCADPPALAKFWQKLLGGKVILDESGDAELHRNGSNVRFDFLKVPEAKAGKNRLHLDLRSRVYDAAIADALSFGATLADDIYHGDEWQVLRDPEGNEFCILRPRSTA
jgi:catechol 2,3-dioxygenase-like lactoylglutathione lyase family enzyme